jgi:hypothetical protein
MLIACMHSQEPVLNSSVLDHAVVVLGYSYILIIIIIIIVVSFIVMQHVLVMELYANCMLAFSETRAEFLRFGPCGGGCWVFVQRSGSTEPLAHSQFVGHCLGGPRVCRISNLP